MNKKYFPWLITFCALGLSTTAAYYSIIGLSLLFSGAQTAVIIMGSFLELSKIVIATLLHNYWSNLKNTLKIYLTTSLIILSFITSAGIYGMLSQGYQDTANKTGVVDKEITLIDNKIKTQESNKNFAFQQLTQTQQSISQLRLALGNNTQTSKDKQGNLITTTSSANRKAYEKQLEFALDEEKILNGKLNDLDSILLKLSEQKLEKESNIELAGELGPLKYISGLTGVSMDRIINWFLLVIIFVFDPLAISLVIAANFAFKNANKHLYTIYNEQPDKPIIKSSKEPQIAPDIQKEIENIKAQSLSAWKRKKLIKDLLEKNNNDQINYM